MNSILPLFSKITKSYFLILSFTINLIAQQKHLQKSPHKITEIVMQRWSPDEGLLQGKVNDIVIDRSGYLWISTKEGLNRFDGNSFRVYRHSDDNPKSIADNYVTALLVDHNNKIWAGTYTNGLDYFDPSTETFTHISLNKLNKKDSGLQNITSIQDAGSGRIMVSINNDFRIIEWNEIKKAPRISDIEAVYPGIHQAFQTSFSYKNLVCQTNGMLWINSQEHIFRYSTKGLEQILIDKTLFKGNSMSIRLWENSFTKQMYLVLGNSLLQYDNTLNTFLPWLELPKPYTFSEFITADQEGNIWTNYKDKFYLRINPKTQVFGLIHPVAIGLNEDIALLTCKVDKQGDVWLGSNGWGLFKISPANLSFKKIKSYASEKFEYGWPFRISKEGINAIYDFNTISDWINKFESSNLYQRGYQKVVYAEHFAVDSDGNYWFYSVNPINKSSVIIKMNALSGVYRIMKEKKFSITDNGFKAFQPIFSDTKSRIWASELTTADSIKIYLFEQSGKNIKEFIFPVIQNSPSEERFISDWAEDRDGTFWFATTAGLFALSPETGKWKVFSAVREKNKSLSLNKLLSVCLDPNQPQKYVWIGTEGSGLNRLDKITGNVATYTIENGLPNNVIYSIQSDKHKNLWLSTNHGICLFDPVSCKSRNFDKSHGLEGNEFNRFQFSKSNTGEIYLGGVGFNVQFNPEDFYIFTTPAKIVINSLKILNKEIEIDNQNTQEKSIITKAIECTPKITLNHNQSMISFGFALLDLKNPVSNYYRYKLIGLYDDWIDNGKKNEAIFTNMAPGSYTFMVSGHNGDGAWSQPTQMELEIEPAWWQTWWLKAITLVFFTILLYLFFQYRISKVVEMEKLRNRIAQDLHDEIGSTLSSVSLYSLALSKSFDNFPEKSAQIIDKISDSTLNMMETMSDIVWSVNPASDSLENLVARMRAYASSVTEAADIKLNFESDFELNKFNITMLQRKNVYLIFKEAVNNSLKHSHSNNLCVKLSMTGKKLSLLVADNGKGMVNENDFELKMGGNGISNMHSRSKESDGSISIISRPEGGVAVQFSINV